MGRRIVNQGFTIIELLVVIVVIGILAAISIVSYTGVTQQANTISAQVTAHAAVGKAELYNIEVNRYPYAASDLTSDPTKSYYLSSSQVSFGPLASQPSSPNTLRFIKCGTAPNTTQADIAIGSNNITGVRFYYWTYTGTPGATQYLAAGQDTGPGINCPLS